MRIMEQIIQDVDQSVRHLIKTKYRKQRNGIIIFMLAWYLLAGYLTYFHNGFARQLSQFIYLIIAIPIIVWSGWRGWIKSKVADLFMQQFAAANGFAYQATETERLDLKGTLFELGSSDEVEDIVSGTYESYPIRLFTYHYTIGSGKHKTTYHRMVFEITLPTKLHRILLRARNQRFGFGFGGFDHPNEIKLGDPFDSAFELGTDKEYEIEALEVVSPAFMEYLLGLPLRFSIEFVEDKLYIYSDKVITKSYELSYFFDITREITTRVAPIATRLKDDVAAMDQFYKK